jgi:hypothetical protein
MVLFGTPLMTYSVGGAAPRRERPERSDDAQAEKARAEDTSAIMRLVERLRGIE